LPPAAPLVSTDPPAAEAAEPRAAERRSKPTIKKERAPRKPKSPAGTSTVGTPGTVSTVSTIRTVSTTSKNSLDILMITPEARPFAKTGGLADVCGALPLALARLGHRVTIVLPKYRGAQTDGAKGRPADVPLGPHSYPVRFIEQSLAEGVTAVLVDAPALYDRDGLYGDAKGEFGDNAFRFGVLCRGALEYTRLRGRRPSVIHAHDWQGALAPVYLRTVLYNDPVIGGVRTVLTIHNLAFQGNFDPAELPWMGLGRDLYTPELLEFWGRGSLLKGGVIFSDKLTTVSPTYAKEILTPEYGFGFNGILANRARDLTGILNGIDTDAWNPATDPYLPVSFDASTLDRRTGVKRAVLEAVNLPCDERAMRRPLIGLVTRLTHQKGCDLVAAAADRLMDFDASWVMLGNGDAWCEDMWRLQAGRHPHRVAARIGFDEKLAHLVEGGADMFLMPSWYEPCGLNQMYSQRYGAVPIVRATGGLNDTVVDAAADPDQATGFTFHEYTPHALLGAVERALGAFSKPNAWKVMQQNGMKRDFSWDVSAREYVKVYRGA
jgi:starch synthase